MCALWVQVDYRGDWWGEDPLTETRWDTPGDLFRSLSGRDRTYPWEALGRCIGKIYVDEPTPRAVQHRRSGSARRLQRYQPQSRHVGWVFVARNPEPVNRGDTQPTGLREAWVTVHRRPPTVRTTMHYANLERHGKR